MMYYKFIKKYYKILNKFINFKFITIFRFVKKLPLQNLLSSPRQLLINLSVILPMVFLTAFILNNITNGTIGLSSVVNSFENNFLNLSGNFINEASAQQPCPRPGLSTTGEGRIYFDKTCENKFMVSENGGEWKPVSLWQGSGGSIYPINEATTNVGIGTTNPTKKLEVAGGTKFNPSSLGIIGSGSSTDYSGRNFLFVNVSTQQSNNLASLVLENVDQLGIWSNKGGGHWGDLVLNNLMTASSLYSQYFYQCTDPINKTGCSSIGGNGWWQVMENASTSRIQNLPAYPDVSIYNSLYVNGSLNLTATNSTSGWNAFVDASDYEYSTALVDSSATLDGSHVVFVGKNNNISNPKRAYALYVHNTPPVTVDTMDISDTTITNDFQSVLITNDSTIFATTSATASADVIRFTSKPVNNFGGWSRVYDNARGPGLLSFGSDNTPRPMWGYNYVKTVNSKSYSHHMIFVGSTVTTGNGKLNLFVYCFDKNIDTDCGKDYNIDIFQNRSSASLPMSTRAITGIVNSNNNSATVYLAGESNSTTVITTAAFTDYDTSPTYRSITIGNNFDVNPYSIWVNKDEDYLVVAGAARTGKNYNVAVGRKSGVTWSWNGVTLGDRDTIIKKIWANTDVSTGVTTIYLSGAKNVTSNTDGYPTLYTLTKTSDIPSVVKIKKNVCTAGDPSKFEVSCTNDNECNTAGQSDGKCADIGPICLDKSATAKRPSFTCSNSYRVGSYSINTSPSKTYVYAGVTGDQLYVAGDVTSAGMLSVRGSAEINGNIRVDNNRWEGSNASPANVYPDDSPSQESVGSAQMSGTDAVCPKGEYMVGVKPVYSGGNYLISKIYCARL